MAQYIAVEFDLTLDDLIEQLKTMRLNAAQNVPVTFDEIHMESDTALMNRRPDGAVVIRY